MFNAGSGGMKKDMELDQPPEDSVSKVAFAPNSNYLVASSWDNNVSLPTYISAVGGSLRSVLNLNALSMF